mmetsp:Transcript_56687/g.179151  ORF Transcript_56687/g.179151 Transcript_56687/m.179151 type:complete len:315 (+) Transcript_56687:1356-2300(+)
MRKVAAHHLALPLAAEDVHDVAADLADEDAGEALLPLLRLGLDPSLGGREGRLLAREGAGVTRVAMVHGVLVHGVGVAFVPLLQLVCSDAHLVAVGLPAVPRAHADRPPQEERRVLGPDPEVGEVAGEEPADPRAHLRGHLRRAVVGRGLAGAQAPVLHGQVHYRPLVQLPLCHAHAVVLDADHPVLLPRGGDERYRDVLGPPEVTLDGAQGVVDELRQGVGERVVPRRCKVLIVPCHGKGLGVGRELDGLLRRGGESAPPPGEHDDESVRGLDAEEVLIGGDVPCQVRKHEGLPPDAAGERLRHAVHDGGDAP